MSGNSARASRFSVALLLAIISAAAAVAVHTFGVDRRLELVALDLRFQHFGGPARPTPAVHIDIDDRSLDELGRWPWPRAQLAGIVDVLHQAGAEAVALDIIMPEPQKRRFTSAASEVYSAEPGELIGQDVPQPIFDDQILARTLRTCGKVFVPMHIRPEPAPAAKLPAKVQQLVQAGVSAFRDIVDKVLPDLDRRATSARYDTARRAYLRSRGLVALGRFAISRDRLDGYPLKIGQITPPLVTIAEACYGSGFVTFDPDVDGVVRRIPLLAGDGQDIYPQFALALAADQLGRGHGGAGEISANARSVTISFADGYRRRIPVDGDGQMLINWSADGRGGAGQHISAGSVGAIWSLSQSIKRNRNRARLLLFALLELKRHWPSDQDAERYYALAALDAKLSETHKKRIAAELAAMRAMLFDPGNVPPAPKALADSERQTEAEMDKLCLTFARDLGRPAYLAVFLAKPTGTHDRADQQRYDTDAARARFLLGQIQLARDSNDAIRRSLSRQIDQLRRLVGGKLCLVGSVATGAADFVPTPIDKRMPGAWVHANILNTIFNGDFIHQAPKWGAVAVIVIAALAIGLITAGMGVLKAGPASLLLAGGYVAFDGFVTFGRMNIWLPVVAPLGAMGLTFVMVTAYRQLTEERAKRRIRGMFAHALSPALVDRLMEDPSLARLGGERRELTFLFSDLQGFTPMAESLGEENTVKLLNTYFDRMTEVIQNRCGGYLNKFLGDGLFVFFGAPVFQADHARRAIRCAIDCQDEMAELNRRLKAELALPVALTMRIGITSGEVMVGNCGSSQRMDYTAIGDPVNLASRLESANKFFGTRILVAEETWKLGGNDAILARPFGKIAVIGREEPVFVWNLASQADAPAGMARGFERFAEAVSLFEAGRFDQAGQAFRAVLDELPDDRPAGIFLDLCEKYASNPPCDGWDGVVRLTEK